MNPKLLGFRIRQARERLHWSQEDLAHAVDKDQRAISEYENGQRKLAASDLPKFATALQVPLLHFFAEDEEIYDLDAALLNYFHQLPTAQARQNAVDILRLFAQTVSEAAG